MSRLVSCVSSSLRLYRMAISSGAHVTARHLVTTALKTSRTSCLENISTRVRCLHLHSGDHRENNDGKHKDSIGMILNGYKGISQRRVAADEYANKSREAIQRNNVDKYPNEHKHSNQGNAADEYSNKSREAIQRNTVDKYENEYKYSNQTNAAIEYSNQTNNEGNLSKTADTYDGNERNATNIVIVDNNDDIQQNIFPSKVNRRYLRRHGYASRLNVDNSYRNIEGNNQVRTSYSRKYTEEDYTTILKNVYVTDDNNVINKTYNDDHEGIERISSNIEDHNTESNCEINSRNLTISANRLSKFEDTSIPAIYSIQNDEKVSVDHKDNSSKSLLDNVIEKDGKLFYKGIYIKDTGAIVTNRKEKHILDSPTDHGKFFDPFNYEVAHLKASAIPLKSNSYLQMFPVLRKNFFSPTTELVERFEDDHAYYLEDHSIQISGSDVPPPIQKFTDHNFPESLASTIQKNFDVPTPMQAQGWSVALQGRDMVGLGKTGSGKTLGYLLPALMHVHHQQEALAEAGLHRKSSPIGMVLVPTRDLARQITSVAQEYGPPLGVTPVDVTGGADESVQLAILRKAKFMVATPGRVLGLMAKGKLHLDLCSCVVVDEADKMLDMSIEPQIRQIMKHTRPDRQTSMWSATWPLKIEDLALEFLNNPVKLCVGNTLVSANPDIEQHVHVCDYKDKSILMCKLLTEMLETNPDAKAIVFVDNNETLQKVLKKLLKRDITTDSLHGLKSKDRRDFTMKSFVRGYFSVLVATDVASRGLDIPGVGLVINYCYPTLTETYIHRIGRTGRAGNKGIAHTIFTHMDKAYAQDLINVLREGRQTVSAELLHLAERAEKDEESGTLALYYPVVDRYGNKVSVKMNPEANMVDVYNRLRKRGSESNKRFNIALHGMLKRRNMVVREKLKRIKKRYRFGLERRKNREIMEEYRKEE